MTIANNLYKVLLALLLPLLFQCGNSSSGESEAGIFPEERENETSESRSLCYAEVSKSAMPDTEGLNYQFTRFYPAEDGSIEGVLYTSFYGKDGSRGSFSGTLDEGSGTISGKTTLLGEGMRFTEDRSFKLLSDAIELGYANPDGTPATLKKVDCAEYDSLFKGFQEEYLGYFINSSDRSRLLKVEELRASGLDAGQLQEVDFLERQVDLDRNFETREYLLYVMGPEFCGTGGCNLWVINEEGDVLSDISVVKLPLYQNIPTSDESMNEKGVWQDLYVWSQGFRRLSVEDGKYPSNASLAPEVSEEELERHPELYQLLLDHQE